MIYYCPKCKKLDTDFIPNKYTPRVVNIRDGYGYPLYHMKCECGNCLAAGIHFEKEEIEKDPRLLDYIKDIITEYNKDGCFYGDGYYEYVEDKINQIELQYQEILKERKRINEMSEFEKNEYFKNKYKEMLGRMGEEY